MKINLIALLFFTLAAGCGKISVDGTDPEIGSFLLNGSETLGTVSAGENITIAFQIKDNEALQEVLLKIVNSGNSELSEADKLLHFQVFTDIDSKNFSETVTVETNPTDLAGRYTLLLQVVDQNGNANNRSLDFILLNEAEQPAVQISGFTPPVQNGVITMNHGDSLVVSGAFVDNTGLAKLSVVLTGPTTLHNDDVTIWEADVLFFDFAWMSKPKVSTDAPTGNYEFQATATDYAGHMTYYTQPVVVQ